MKSIFPWFIPCLVFAVQSISPAATIFKESTGTDLADGASWMGSTVPTAADIATWSAGSVTSGLSLPTDVNFAGLSLVNAAGAVDISGPGKLTLGADGVDLAGAAFDSLLANKIELAAAQAWRVGSARTLQVSGEVSGSEALTAGALPPTLNYSGYLSANSAAPTTVFTGATLANFLSVGGTMSGGWIVGSRATGTYFFVNNGSTATYQLQFFDSPYTKVAKVQLTQTGGDVTAYQVYAKYKTGNLLGTDFDGVTSDGAPPVGSAGYGVQTTFATTGVAPAGTIFLSGTNPFTGPLNILSGMVQAGSVGALGVNSAVTLANTAGAALDLNGFNNSIGSLSGGGALGGNVTLGTGVLTVGGANTSPAAFSGSMLAANGGLVKTGTGNFTFGPSAVQLATVTISSGTLTTTNGNFGTLATITLGDANTGANNVALLTTGSSVSQPITVTANGTGTATIGGNGGAGNTIFGGIITLNRPTTISAGSTDRTTFMGDITGNVGTLTISGGRRTVLDTPTKTFVGNVDVTGTATVLQTGVGTGTEHLPDSASVNVGTGAFFKLAGVAGSIETIDGLTGVGNVRRHEGVGGVQTLVVGSANSSATFGGILENGAGPLALTKSGTGTQTLTGINTYSGTTTVLAGTLKLGTGGSINNSALISVAPGAVFDAVETGFTLGTGKILVAGDNDVAEDVTGALVSQGTIRPAGNAAIGTLRGLTNLTLGGILDWDRAASTTVGDSIAINGVLTISPNFAVNITSLGIPVGGVRSYVVVSGLTAALTAGDLANLPVLPANYVWDSTSDPTALKIVHTQPGANLKWAGDLSGDWNLATANWNDGLPGILYAEGDLVTFDDTAVAKTVDIVADVEPGAVSVNNTVASPLTLTSTGGFGIIGGTQLVKVGSGKFTLSSINSYTGGTTLTEGILEFANGGLSTNGTTRMDGGTLQWATGNTQDVSSTLVFLPGKTAVFDTNGNTVTLLNVMGSAANTGIQKVGLGDLRVTSITCTGTTEVGGGSLTALNNTSFGTTPVLIGNGNGEASFKLANRADISNNITVSATGNGLVNIVGENTGTGANAATLLGSLTLNRPTTLRGEVFGDRLAVDGKVSGNVGVLTVTGGSRTTLFATTNDFVGSILVTGPGTILQCSVGTAAEVIPNATDVLVTNGAAFQLSSSAGAETIDALDGDATAIVRTHFTGLYGSGLIVGSNDGNGNFAGTMTDGGTNNPLSLIKAGAGTQVLGGFNTHTGNTVVQSGTLELADNAALTFRITNTTSNTITGAGTLVLNGNFAIDTAAFTGAIPTSWVIENVTTLTGSYGATFQVVTPAGVPWRDIGSETWKLEQGAYAWTFVETTGTLSVALSGYAQWAMDNAPGQSEILDHDGDGVANAIEYFMGESGSGFTTNPSLGVDKKITWPKGANYTGTYGTDYYVETSLDLINWAPEAEAAVTITGTDLQFTLPSTSPVKFVRLRVNVP